MILAIASALLPILFVVLLGWLAARTRMVPSSAAGYFATFVVTFALPLSLFLAAAEAKPSDLSNAAFIFSLVIGLIATFGVGIALGKLVFKHDLRASAVQGMSCGFPNMAYCGPPVLGVVVGPGGLLAVVVGNLVTSLIMVPVTLVLLHRSGGKRDCKEGADPAHSQARVIGASLLGAVKQPLVWLPVLGVACALLGVRLPALLTGMTKEIGSAAGGVALFTLGLMLAGEKLKLDREVLANVVVKNILQPVLLLGVALALGLRGNLAQEVFLIGVLPSATLVPAFAHSNKAYEGEAPLTTMASTLFSILSISIGIVVAKAVL